MTKPNSEQRLFANRILTDMSDGVLALDLSGRIITFNPAAAAILGVSKEDAKDKSFAELFMLTEDNDDFTQAILDAIYESSTSHNRVVPFAAGKDRKMLSITTSYLKGDENNHVGLVAVISDITALHKLQESEKRMAAELEAKHRELQNAYLKMEESNRNLQSVLKKIQVIRIAATIFTIALFVGAGFYSWHSGDTVSRLSPALKLATDINNSDQTITVRPDSLSATIDLSGFFQPLGRENISSPLAGRVKQLHVHLGDVVRAGQPLLEMDTSDSEIKLREAEAAWIKAQNVCRKLVNWEQGEEMARNRRSLARAKMALENQEKSLQETKRLFDQGIVPEIEYLAAQQQLTNLQLDFQGATRELQAVRAKGNEEQIRIARFALENARLRRQQLVDEIAAANLVAPVSGVILPPQSGNQQQSVRLPDKNATVSQGDALLAIGDLSGYSVVCKVDEIDVIKIKTEQKVIVSNDAFSEIRLTGKVRSVSPATGDGLNRSRPFFLVTVVIEKVDPDIFSKIFIGMSANLKIVLYEKK